MKTIELTKGNVAIVDDEDYEELSKHSWCMFYKYAGRSDKGNLVLMHRFILDAPNDLMVDHINGNPLDNRRCNLRLATGSQNQANRKLNKNNTSGYKGVYYCKRKNRIKRWRAMIHIKRKKISLGFYHTPEEAAIAYNKALKEQYGEYARLN